MERTTEDQQEQTRRLNRGRRRLARQRETEEQRERTRRLDRERRRLARQRESDIQRYIHYTSAAFNEVFTIRS